MDVPIGRSQRWYKTAAKAVIVLNERMVEFAWEDDKIRVPEHTMFRLIDGDAAILKTLEEAEGK